MSKQVDVYRERCHGLRLKLQLVVNEQKSRESLVHGVIYGVREPVRSCKVSKVSRESASIIQTTWRKERR